MLYCIICGEELQTHKKGQPHIHEHCKPLQKLNKTRYCFKCGIPLTKTNRRQRKCSCKSCDYKKRATERKLKKIHRKKDLLIFARNILEETGFMSSTDLFNQLYKHRSNRWDFSKASMSMRLKNDKEHRFSYENGLWSLRSPEMIEMVEMRIKGVI